MIKFKQAKSRSHRTGQTKDVQDFTLLCKDAIDETFLKIQDFKLNLKDNSTNDGNFVFNLILHFINNFSNLRIGF